MELYISNYLKHSDMNDMETQASPTMIHMKQSDLKIVIDNTMLDEKSPSPSPRHTKEDIDYISQMVEKIKSLAKKKTINGNLWEFSPCHSCRGLLEKKLLVRCIDEECSRYFCLRCMNKKFSISCEEIYNIIQLGRWSCFSCEGMCNCKICKNRFSEHQIEFFPKQLLPFEKSKKKSAESPSFKKSELQEESSIPTTIERQTSKQSISSTKESKINNKKSKDKEKKSKKEIKTKTLEIPTESERSKPSYKKQESPKIMRTKQSKLRSKILAKQKLKEHKYLHESSSSSEEEEESKVEKPEETQVPPETEKPDLNKENKRTQKNFKKPPEECHLCSKMIPSTMVAVCSVEKCRKGFCTSCINETFQQDFTLKNYNADCWICYRCAGVCKCSKCSRKRTTTFKIASDDLIQPADFKRMFNKNLIHKRPKFYDPITDDEDTIRYHNESETEESEDEEVTKCLVLRSLQNKRKRLNKGPFVENNTIEANKELIEA